MTYALIFIFVLIWWYVLFAMRCLLCTDYCLCVDCLCAFHLLLRLGFASQLCQVSTYLTRTDRSLTYLTSCHSASEISGCDWHDHYWHWWIDVWRDWCVSSLCRLASLVWLAWWRSPWYTCSLLMLLSGKHDHRRNRATRIYRRLQGQSLEDRVRQTFGRHSELPLHKWTPCHPWIVLRFSKP